MCLLRCCVQACLGGGGLVDVGNQVGPVLLLLQPGEDHLGAGDVLLGVDEVLVQGVLAPGDALVLVGLRSITN